VTVLVEESELVTPFPIHEEKEYPSNGDAAIEEDDPKA
jgi:hypothetical protein